MVLAIALGARELHGMDDEFVRRVIVNTGSFLSLAAFLVPFMIVRQELLDPRGLRGFRIRWGSIAIVLLVFTLIGPTLLIAPIAWAPTWAWGDPESVRLAQIAAPLLFLQGVLSIRLGVAAGSALAKWERWSRRVRIIGVPVLLIGLTVVAATLIPRLAAEPPVRFRTLFVGLLKLSGFVHTEEISQVLQWTP
ncbi:MAG: hypothetical protein KDC98_03800, partial [Planctomycetes bacterium]|nr:hypothetical protein [Planctomycetota bacterium]